MLQLLEPLPGRHWLTVGADRGYDCPFFVKECRKLRVDAHLAARKTGSAIDPELILRLAIRAASASAHRWRRSLASSKPSPCCASSATAAASG